MEFKTAFLPLLRIQYLYFLGLLALLLGQSACQEDRVYEKNFDLSNNQWYVDSSLVFQFEIEDVKQSYDFYYNIRNTLQYPYQNLYLTFYLEDEQGNLLDEELQNVTLFDAKTGKPFGSGFGSIFSHQLPIPKLKSYTFPRPGKYTYRLVQFMRQDPLPELVSVGLKIVPSGG